LLALSVPIIQQGSQDISAFYLANIYQQLSTQPDGSQAPIPSLSDPTEPFTPPTSGVWVNGLWFSSLVISLTCALLATLLQQWARRYQRVAHPRYNPHKRARIRAFYKHGVEKLHIPLMVEALPALLHTSLFLFFAGLSVFLFGVHLTIFKVVTTWIGLCFILYACLTFLPVIRKDSPYSAPLSSSVSFCLTGIRHLFFRLLKKFPDIDRSDFTLFPSRAHLYEFFSYSMDKTAEQFALKMSPKIDHLSLMWTFDSLDEDSDLAKFFEAFSRLCDSETGKELELQQGFIGPHKTRLSNALIGLMNRTLSSNLVTEPEKQRRITMCTKAVKSTSLLEISWILRRVLLEDWYQFLGSSEFGLFVQYWNTTDRVMYFYAKCVVALTVSLAQRDERWFQLAGSLLNAPRSLLNTYIANGDNIRLAGAIFVVRQTIQTYSGSAWDLREEILDVSSRTLETVCRLDIRGTLPELQHQFCGLWNKVVNTAQNDQHPHHRRVSMITLKNIRHLYIALHENPDTPQTAFYTTTNDCDPVLDNPMSYPMCMIDGHSSFSVPDLEFDEPDPRAAEDSLTAGHMLMPTPFRPALPSSSPPHMSAPSAPVLSMPSPPPIPAPSAPVSPFTYPLHMPRPSAPVLLSSPHMSAHFSPVPSMPSSPPMPAHSAPVPSMPSPPPISTPSAPDSPLSSPRLFPRILHQPRQ
jgi:hypothetical protein